MRMTSFLAIGLMAVSAGCSSKGSSEAPPTIIKAVAGRPGLTPAEQAAFYHLEEGSEVFPVTWFLALEKEDGSGLFADSLQRFGLIPDARSATNPFGLPVGLTAAQTRD